MKRKTKIIILCTSIAVSLGCLYGATWIYKYFYYKSFDQYDSLSPLYEVTKLEKSDSNSYLVVKWNDKTRNDINKFEKVGFKVNQGNVQVSSNYLTVDAKKVRKATIEGDSSPKSDEYWFLDLYDLKEQSLRKKRMNLFNVVNNYDSSLVPVHVYPYQLKYGQKYYLQVAVRNKFTKETLELILDLETRELVEPFDEFRNYVLDDQSSIYNWGFHNKMAALFPSQNTTYGGFSLAGEKLHRDTKLAIDYPKLYNLLNEKGTAIYLLSDHISIENIQPFLELFYPEGTNIYSNLEINSYTTVDGENHRVNSFEEYKRYSKMFQ